MRLPCVTVVEMSIQSYMISGLMPRASLILKNSKCILQLSPIAHSHRTQVIRGAVRFVQLLLQTPSIRAGEKSLGEESTSPPIGRKKRPHLFARCRGPAATGSFESLGAIPCDSSPNPMPRQLRIRNATAGRGGR